MSRPQPSEEDRKKVTQALTLLKEMGDKYGSPQQASADLFEQKENLNILPLPDTQEVVIDRIVWTWRISNWFVYGTLFTRGSLKGEYAIALDDDALSPESAKDLGQALVSASGYNKIWKDHAGTFIEREFEQDDVEIQKQVAVPFENDVHEALPPEPDDIVVPLKKEADWDKSTKDNDVEVIDKRKYRPERFD